MIFKIKLLLINIILELLNIFLLKFQNDIKIIFKGFIMKGIKCDGLVNDLIVI